MHQRERGFTLVELLVVITILVVLLALLAPALDKAVYQAELVRCAANLRAIGGGAINYAGDYRRMYPPHPGRGARVGGWQLSIGRNLTSVPLFDRRPLFKSYIPLEWLIDPLCGKVDLESPPSDEWTYSSVMLWFGTGYPGQKAMSRQGDGLQWSDMEFRVLASDSDYVSSMAPVGAGSSHPDEADFLQPVVRQNFAASGVFIQTYSRWAFDGSARRGALDTNYAYDDGSVDRYNGVAWNEGEAGDPKGRLVKVPIYMNETRAGWNAAREASIVPRR